MTDSYSSQCYFHLSEGYLVQQNQTISAADSLPIIKQRKLLSCCNH